MNSFTSETQRPVYWTSVTWYFVLLAALCSCNALPHQETVKMADPLHSASDSSTLPDVTEQPENVAVDLGYLLDAGDGAVVTLAAGVTKLAAHRAVLAAGSPVLAAMFRSDMLEASSSEIDIPDVEGPVLRQLVAYLYTGRVPQLPGMALQLLAAAEKYGVSALRDSIEQQVAGQMSVENAAATAVLVLRCGSLSLRQATIAFIKGHLEVVGTKGWAQAVLNHPGEVLQITRLLAEPFAKTSATADSTPALTTAPAATTATGGSHSDHSQAAATDPLPTAGRHTPSPDVADASRLGATAAKDSKPISTTPPAATTATPTTRDRMPTTTITPSTVHAATTATPNATESSSTPTAVPHGTPTTVAQPHSDLGWTGSQALLPTSSQPAPTPDAAEVSRLRSLPYYQKDWMLMKAAKKGAVEEARALIAAGADVGARDYQRYTALHWAAHYGHAAVVRLLLAASADPNAMNILEWTPLHVAAMTGQVEAAAALLEAGADKWATTVHGDTPLDHARQYKHSKLIEMLQ